jgi:hypothetical protein
MLSIAGTYLNDASTLTIGTVVGSAAVLDLPNSGTDLVASLVIDGVVQPDGIYNSANSGGAITGNGQIEVGASVGSSYVTWASGFTGPALSDTAFDADPDFDGIENALEYVLGSDPRVSEQPAGLPASTVAGGDLIFTFNRDDASETSDIILIVEVSEDLSDWTTLPSYTIGSEAPEVDIQENGVEADTITVTIPGNSAAKKFARLTVL